MIKRRLTFLAVLTLLVSSLLLAACDGVARVNVDVDPDTGEGTIDIEGSGGEGDTSGGSEGGEGESTAGNGQVDQGDIQTAIIFATAVALLLGVTAIVVSLSNRSRNQS